VRIRPRRLRWRLVLVLAIITIFASASVAGFVLIRYRSDLSREIDESLETRYADVRAALHRARLSTSRPSAAIIPKAEVFAQVLTTDGTILAASPRLLLDRPVLSPRELSAVAHRKQKVEQPVPLQLQKARLLAGPENLGNRRVVVVVGSPLDQPEHSQAQLERALLIALPVFAAVVIGVGWILVGAALRPVGAMVSESDAISSRHRGRRLSEQGPTELGELARHLNDMLARIEAAIEHERAFLDDASHELRTPIAIARGELELARPIVADDEAARDAVDSALEEIERLETLALNLLVLARMRAAGPPPEQRVDLRVVSEQAAAGLLRARDAGRVDLDISGNASTIGDASALERAVGNLVENALRHADHSVRVDLSEVGAAAVVEVSDDGPGFPSTVVDRAGQRFVPGALGTAGLGLAIVDAIADTHGGRLELTARPQEVGGGAVAILRLPRAPAPMKVSAR